MQATNWVHELSWASAYALVCDKASASNKLGARTELGSCLCTSV